MLAPEHSAQKCIERRTNKWKQAKDQASAVTPTDGDGPTGSKIDRSNAEPEPEPEGADGKTVVTESPLRGASAGGDPEAAGALALQSMLSKTSSGAGNGAEEFNPLATLTAMDQQVSTAIIEVYQSSACIPACCSLLAACCLLLLSRQLVPTCSTDPQLAPQEQGGGGGGGDDGAPDIFNESFPELAGSQNGSSQAIEPAEPIPEWTPWWSLAVRFSIAFH